MDHIRRTMLESRLVFHEEVARDGAQGKSLLGGAQRVAIARAHSALMGPEAYENLVFMSGFPSAGKEEFEVVRQVVAEVETCYIGAAGRLVRHDIDELIRAMTGARYGRIVLILPISIGASGVLLRRSPAEGLVLALDAVHYAKDESPDLQVDVALLDAARAETGLVAEAAVKLTAAGASTIIVCDTVGSMFPKEASTFFEDIQRRANSEATFIVHMHNDLGFGLINTVTALEAGIRGLTSSWLGLGERSGMPATEQLLFVLGHDLDRLAARVGVGGPLWSRQPDLRAIVPLAIDISRFVGFDRRTTDPIVGSGVNSISTGIPFADPLLFSPFDAEAVLGTTRTVLLTALASKAIVADVSERLGFALTSDQLSEALIWVKARAHEQNTAVVQELDFRQWLMSRYVGTEHMRQECN